ncbi:putative YopX superfamily protein [Vibrio phage 168E36-1]|nr:putative YopX superfamily protein [Vibrio phage 168E36-1]
MKIQVIWQHDGSTAKSTLSVEELISGLAVAPTTKGKKWELLVARYATGALDIEGNSIMSGDVVESDYYFPDFEEKAIIGYDNHEMKFCFNDQFGNLKGEQDAFKYGNLKVIGNIYENPELKGKVS